MRKYGVMKTNFLTQKKYSGQEYTSTVSELIIMQ